MDTGGADRKQWPEAPYEFAKWLRKTTQHDGSCLEVLRKFDQGLMPHAFKKGSGTVPKKYIYPAQLKTLAMMYVFSGWATPVAVFRELEELAGNQLGVVTSFVKAELDLHFALPPALGKVAQCFRPDIVNVALKVWRHGNHVGAIDTSLQSIASPQWVFNPYCRVGPIVLSVLTWAGAAMLVTGRKRHADIVIGQTFIITTEKDRMAAVLILLLCCQTDSTVRACIKAGPVVFRPLLEIGEVF